MIIFTDLIFLVVSMYSRGISAINFNFNRDRLSLLNSFLKDLNSENDDAMKRNQANSSKGIVCYSLRRAVLNTFWHDLLTSYEDWAKYIPTCFSKISKIALMNESDHVDSESWEMLSPMSETGSNTCLIRERSFYVLLECSLMQFSKISKFGQHFSSKFNYRAKLNSSRNRLELKTPSEQSCDTAPIKHTIRFAVSRWVRMSKTARSYFCSKLPRFSRPLKTIQISKN